MDWGRAKSILIVVFFVLNIFLAVNLVMERWVPSISNDQIKTAENILKQREITLKTAIPKISGKSTRLAFEGIAQFDMQTIASKLLGVNVVIDENKNIVTNGNKEISIENKFSFLYTNKSPQDELDIDNDKSIEKSCRDFLKGVGFPASNLILDYVDKNTTSVKTLKFVQKEGQYIVFNNKIDVTVSKDGITTIYCSLQKPSTIKRDNDYIMPAYKVLLENLWQNNGLVILAIDLGYTIDVVDGEMTAYYERLHWRIRTDSGELYYDAVTGKPKKI